MTKQKEQKKESNIRTFSFKTKETSERVETFWKPAIQQYINLYNKVSLWLANNLTTYTIGQIADLLRQIKGSENKMVVKLSQSEYADLNLYHVFKLKSLESYRDNVLYELVNLFNVDDYKGNNIGFGETYYRNWGYVKAVAGSYESKFSSFKVNVRKKKITDNSSKDDMIEQYIYESNSRGRTTIKEWNDFITYIVDNNFDKDYVERIKTIVDFYKSNQSEVDSRIEELTVKQLAEFFKVGCQRKTNKLSMMLEFNSGYNWKHIDGTNDFQITLFGNRRKFTIDAFCHKQVLKDNNLLIDLNRKCTNICFSIKNGRLFANASFNVDFKKDVYSETPSNTINIGIDINTKHALRVTSIKDNGSLSGYINIYKEMLKDNAIVTEIKRLGLFDDWKQQSKIVNFCPLECDLILGKYESMKYDADNDFSRLDDLIYNKMVELRDSASDVYVHDYISRVILIRREIRAYLSLYFKKMELQSAYDKTFSNQDELINSPFRNTKTGEEIITKMRNTQQRLKSNRDNVISYAYKMFQNNGYKYISLELLESAQFGRNQFFPTPFSMLKKHDDDGNLVGILGMNSTDLENDERYQKFKDDYVITFDNGVVSDCVYSLSGWTKCRRSHLNNVILKIIHFADIKDKFVQLANNGDIQIALVNPQYTSLMDSNTNSLYIVEYVDDKGKNKRRLAKKSEVRSSQESHKNGLNADFNAACNIRNRITDSYLCSMLMTKSKTNGYNTAMFVPQSNTVNNVILGLKKIGRTITIQGSEPVFV